MNLDKKLLKYKETCSPIKSLFEIEYFLRNISCVKNSLCLVKSAKKLTNNKPNPH